MTEIKDTTDYALSEPFFDKKYRTLKPTKGEWLNIIPGGKEGVGLPKQPNPYLADHVKLNFLNFV